MRKEVKSTSLQQPTSEEDRWTSDIMKTIHKHDTKEIRASVRQFHFDQQVVNSNNKDYVCMATEPKPHIRNTTSKISKLDVIREKLFENEDMIPHYTLADMEQRISTASCHKRRRGLKKKVVKMNRLSAANIDKRGIIRCEMKIQNDPGATHCITNNKALLSKFRNIVPMAVAGIAKDDTALHATGVGMLILNSEEGDRILIECLYSPDADGTLISPTAITTQYNEIFEGWSMFANTTTNNGYMQFIHHDGVNHATFSMYCENRLWYHYLNTDDAKHMDTPSIRRLSTLSQYTLWHHRLGHPNDAVMMKMHKFAKGIPKFKTPDFYKCQTCALGKIKKDSSTKTKASLPSSLPTPTEQIHPGQHLHADFGFVRGSAFSRIDEKGRTFTSRDGFRSYLIIVDRATRYKWVFLTKTKHPPLKELKSVLEKHKHLTANLNCTIRTDQGGELGKSNAFKELVKDCGYTYEPTGTDSSKQNGMAERPNQDLKRITRCLLHAAGLTSEYWSFAMNHAVFLLNRLYHSTIGMTPHQSMFKTQPNLSDLKIFGSKCYFKHTKKNQKSMDIAGEAGVFLGYTATQKNVYVKSDKSNLIHTVLHKSFDEAFMTTPLEAKPPMAQALQQAGFDNTCSTPHDKVLGMEDPNLHAKLLSDEAKLPTRSTKDSVGYDIYSTSDILIQPGEHEMIATDIAIAPDTNTYAQLCTRSSMAIKGRSVLGGVIDPDYRGNVKVILQNNSNEPYAISKHDRIAQMVFKMITRPNVKQVETLHDTIRGQKGFGSKDEITLQRVNPKSLDNLQSTTAQVATATVIDDYNITFSENPYENEISITVENKGDHPTKGLDVIFNDEFEKVQVIACEKGTPAGKIDKWRSTLRNSFILDVNNTPITSISQLKRTIQDCDAPQMHIRFATVEKQALHPQHGVTQLYFDQMNQIGRHLFTLAHDPDWLSDEQYNGSITVHKLRGGIIPKGRRRGAKLTRRKLQQRDDWQDWRKSEDKQLDQYELQQMFEEPCLPPPGANILPFLWTYLVKDDGTKKARCVCNGAPSKGTITLGPTYAGSLDQTGARIFWAAAANFNMKVYGADVSNAFAEAPPPVAPLYITVDNQFRQWWKDKGRGDIPQGYALKVKRALQGHPESARQWAVLIDKLIRTKLKLTPTTHEPCLYSGVHKGHKILFLRQVDDFAIACKDETIAKDIINSINQHMSVKIKYLGLLTRYNGVDIEQTSTYIKIYNTTYIDKILQGHKQWLENKPCPNMPMPMKSENAFIKRIENAKAPITDRERIRLQKQMQFNYRQAVGELIYAMVTCRPDISYPLIKLSQYSTNPAREHYEAIKDIYYYLQCTKADGIYYWRKELNHDLPATSDTFDNEPEVDTLLQDNSSTLKEASDSDWGGDTTHRRSMTGFIIKLAGGAIYYKSKYQPTIALSSTEAEFVAATEAGKAILYIRTILEELNISQKDATILHVDNNGALNMANQRQPTKSTRHMELKQFAIQQWVEKDLLYLRRITTSDNYADAMTKQLGRIKFILHFNYIMGRLRPAFADFPYIDNESKSIRTAHGGVSVRQADRECMVANNIQGNSPTTK